MNMQNQAFLCQKKVLNPEKCCQPKTYTVQGYPKRMRPHRQSEIPNKKKTILPCIVKKIAILLISHAL